MIIQRNPNQTTLTPVARGASTPLRDYSTTLTFDVVVSEVTGPAAANTLGLNITGPAGLTFSGYEAGDGLHVGNNLIFTVTVTYSDITTPFPTGEAELTLNLIGAPVKDRKSVV